MTILTLPDHTGAVPVTRTIDVAERRRVSGPGFRTFLAIADAWNVSTQNRLMLLGEPSKSTYHEWVKKAKNQSDLTLPLDTLTRISALLGIHKGLAIVFPIDSEKTAWLNGPHFGEIFGGQAPIQLAIDGGIDGLLTLRRYVDAWRGGLRDGLCDGPGQGTFEPVRPGDIVYA